MTVWLQPAEWRRGLLEDARTGFLAPLKELSPKWLYDEEGCRLFDEITRLPEYYPTRCEREILRRRAEAIARVTQAETLVELGSGTSEKTRLLLNAALAQDSLRTFVPFDVSQPTLEDATLRLAAEYPRLRIEPVVGDFERHIRLLPRGERTLVAFLGGTLGNFKPRPRAHFLRQLAQRLGPDDALLLGADLIKDRRRLEAAYDDAAGVTAQFNLNVLSVLNRELDADFRPERFQHRAVFDDEQGWVEMLLYSRVPQTVRIGALDMEVPFAQGEPIRTEVSAKFTQGRLADELYQAGFELAEWWTDANSDFALCLARPKLARADLT